MTVISTIITMPITGVIIVSIIVVIMTGIGISIGGTTRADIAYAP